jgi:DNA-binding CsgD family transcriptional regulator
MTPAGPALVRSRKTNALHSERDRSVLNKNGQKAEAVSFNGRSVPVRPGAFVFCERISGAMRFQVEASPDGDLPVEQAASLLAMNCLVRGHAPTDYTVLVVPCGSLLAPVGERAKELLGAWREFGTDVELSHREQEVLECVLLNLSNKEIGQRLFISERTVRFHVSSLLTKFNVTNRVALMRQATIGMIPASAAPANTLFGLPVPGK